MKRTRMLFALLLVMAFGLNLVGCYMISGQRMDALKGTYKLTNYTYTPQYNSNNSYRPATSDYINDAKYQYEDYLIITGTEMGYYVHKDASGNAYVKEVSIVYERNAEDSSKIEYVTYYDAASRNQTQNENRLGVSGNTLNYSSPGLDIGSIRTRDLYVRWEKVDRTTDLSYAKAQVGDLKEYDYQGFAARGIYELETTISAETGEVIESRYQYFFYVLDTSKDAPTATVCYALKETPTAEVKETVALSNLSGDWSRISIYGAIWERDPLYGKYNSEADGLGYTIYQASRNILDAQLQDMITNRLPTE